MFSLFLLSCLILSASSYVEAATGSWATIPMNVPPFVTDDGFNPATAPVLFGTPPQEVNLTVNLAAGAVITYAYDCILCSGTSSFDPSLSSTYHTSNVQWSSSTPLFNGIDVYDTMGFDGVLSITNQSFVNILTGANSNLTSLLWNGHLGIFMNPLNTSTWATNFLTRLYLSNSLLNPVVGMRFDPANPKITVGALDPNDYEGTINWVPMNPNPDPNGDFYNTFTFDGVKGYNGSFVPYGGSLTGTLDSLVQSIYLPNADVYFNHTGFTGPVPDPIAIDPSIGLYEYNCTTSTSVVSGPTASPQSVYAAFTTTINGVDYQIDSANNLVRQSSGFSASGFCPIGLMNRSDTLQPNVVLGLPFLRSVYVAYRFPTDNCPGYYGFAFPSGANRTESQISQTPTSTPTNSAQCLSMIAPTSTPTANVVLAQDMNMSSNSYDVYGQPGAQQMQLLGVDDLPQMVWNLTDMSSV